jgi:hypothetical protein
MKISNSLILLIFLLFQTGCELFPEKEIIDDGRNIRFMYNEGLNEDPWFRLSKDKNGLNLSISLKKVKISNGFQ